ncbi:helix-turn-helix domain-containing protein [Halorussus salinisoli]|uniref:helix-turn-helix domain-containing protein n=1 Tax=Halorussus salinisoli TaxID=2558242 RepID=UPI0010C1D309|nr:helix-turn-helix domain-containing protein [Halorussus salinisoli]
MTLIADYYLETPILRTALRAAPEMSVAIEQQTSRETKPFALAFWATDGDFEAFETGLADDPTVDDVMVLAELKDQRLYQVELTDDADEHMTYHSWADLGAVFISSERVGDGWNTRIRFPDRESLQQYVEFCERHGLTFDLQKLYAADDYDGGDSLGLTECQYEALRTATERGYFEVPRRVELEDLADALDISRQAVSERLRRATETLVRATIYRDSEKPDREKSEKDG